MIKARFTVVKQEVQCVNAGWFIMVPVVEAPRFMNRVIYTDEEGQIWANALGEQVSGNAEGDLHTATIKAAEYEQETGYKVMLYNPVIRTIKVNTVVREQGK